MNRTDARVVREAAEVEILRAVLADGRDMNQLAEWLACTTVDAGDIYRESKRALAAPLDTTPGTPSGNDLILFIRSLPEWERKIAFDFLLLRTGTIAEMARSLGTTEMVVMKLLVNLQGKISRRFPKWR